MSANKSAIKKIKIMLGAELRRVREEKGLNFLIMRFMNLRADFTSGMNAKRKFCKGLRCKRFFCAELQQKAKILRQNSGKL